MSMETDLFNLLKPICPQVYPDVAPANAIKPYTTWQQIGGEALRYGDNTASDKRWHLMQINVWSTKRTEALTLIRQIEEAVCGFAQWQAEPEGEAMSTYESSTLLYGCIQRFRIFAAR